MNTLVNKLLAGVAVVLLVVAGLVTAAALGEDTHLPRVGSPLQVRPGQAQAATENQSDDRSDDCDEPDDRCRHSRIHEVGPTPFRLSDDDGVRDDRDDIGDDDGIRDDIRDDDGVRDHDPDGVEDRRDDRHDDGHRDRHGDDGRDDGGGSDDSGRR